jgi:orotate phosphoribosyltransferase-like protein
VNTGGPAWATARFGLELHDRGGIEPLDSLVSPGLRRNPRRAHLLVSNVLGKHIAVDPRIVIKSAHRLGAAVAVALDREIHGGVDVLGMAETATSLGHCVADALDAALYLHTTRRRLETSRIYAEFQEGHSHATDHTLQPSSGELLCQSRPLVIVDDEISTGVTALAAIEQLQRLQARPRYIVASLVDVRSTTHRRMRLGKAGELGTTIDFVSLATGEVRHSDGLIDEVCALDPPVLNCPTGLLVGTRRRVALAWPEDVSDGGRHGFLSSDRDPFTHAVEAATDQLAAALDVQRPLLVVGHEELMYLPLRIAQSLADRGYRTRFQSTTRSPAYVVDHPDYPLRVGYTFSASEPGESGSRFLYNGWPTATDDPHQILLVVDSCAAAGVLDGLDSPVEVLTTAGYDVTVAVVAGPDAAALAHQRQAV